MRYQGRCVGPREHGKFLPAALWLPQNAVQPSEETKNVIRGGELKKLTRKVERIQGELDSIDAEIEQLEAAKVRPSLPTDPPQVNSLKQWFARHGEPGPAPPGYLSSFTKKPKIYGGTNHHRGAPLLSQGRVCGCGSRQRHGARPASEEIMPVLHAPYCHLP